MKALPEKFTSMLTEGIVSNEVLIFLKNNIKANN